MGTCKYCCQSAGLLKSVHAECESKFQSATDHISALFQRVVIVGHSEKALIGAVENTAAQTGFPAQVRRDIICTGWEKCLEYALSDNLLTSNEETYLIALRDRFHLTEQELDSHSAYRKMIQGTVLRDISEGIVSSRVQFTGYIPFNLQRDESIIWLFSAVDYHRMTTTQSFVGNSYSTSVRIANGVYYTPSAYRGRTIETDSLKLIDRGQLAVTNKHIYFKGAVEGFRIQYAAITAFEPFARGIGIHRDSTNAKLEYFDCGDGWFIHNLVVNLAMLNL